MIEKTRHYAVALTLLCVIATSALSGCAGLRPGFETPTVTVSTFRALPSEGMMPNFEIGLSVINPNAEALQLRGISYTVVLEGHELIKGVANDLPVIEAYGQGQVKLTAAANLFAGIRIISELMKSAQDSFDYELEAKLDVGRFLPAIRVKDAGKISLRSAVDAT